MAIVKTNNNGSRSSLLPDFFSTDRFFSDLWNQDWAPSVNIAETEKNYEIDLSAPGFKKEDFKIEVENDVLNISAETKEEKEEKDKNYSRREFSYNSFSRSFSLPQNANAENINAKYDNGILKLSLAKKAIENAKRKQVKVG